MRPRHRMRLVTDTLTLTNADEAYNFTFPQAARRMLVTGRPVLSDSTWTYPIIRWAMDAVAMGQGDYQTIPAGKGVYERDLNFRRLAADRTIAFASPTAGSIVEISYWHEVGK